MDNKAWIASALAAAALLVACTDQSATPPHPGEAVYQRYCFACHQSGVAGAPPLADKGAWAPRIATGQNAMLDNVKRGMTPGMPPRGGCPACTDAALAAAVEFMVLSAE